jgi:P-type Ca2+ transporter type 2C
MANGAWGRQMTDSGLTQREAQERLARFGANALPETAVDSLLAIFLRQFLSPLIYILVAAALVSLVVSDIKDALFIGAVLVVNGIVGAAQEYSAGRAAAALRRMEQSSATVIRDGQRREIDARDLVPGDTVLLEAGGRVPADIRLLEAGDLRCDESLLTGRVRTVAQARRRSVLRRGRPRASRLLRHLGHPRTRPWRGRRHRSVD